MRRPHLKSRDEIALKERITTNGPFTSGELGSIEHIGRTLLLGAVDEYNHYGHGSTGVLQNFWFTKDKIEVKYARNLDASRTPRRELFIKLGATSLIMTVSRIAPPVSTIEKTSAATLDLGRFETILATFNPDRDETTVTGEEECVGQFKAELQDSLRLFEFIIDPKQLQSN